jgi:hypothetical protein
MKKMGITMILQIQNKRLSIGSVSAVYIVLPTEENCKIITNV